MAGLVLKMAPKERVLINGAVVENGNKRSRFSIVSPNAHVLRLKDAVRPEDAKTPISRLCYQLQLVLAGCEVNSEVPSITSQIEMLGGILTDRFSQERLRETKTAWLQGNYYHALRSAKALLPLENALLTR